MHPNDSRVTECDRTANTVNARYGTGGVILPSYCIPFDAYNQQISGGGRAFATLRAKATDTDHIPCAFVRQDTHGTKRKGNNGNKQH